jgi:hypothetical protein
MILEKEALLLLDTIMILQEFGVDIHSECANLDEAFQPLEPLKCRRDTAVWLR